MSGPKYTPVATQDSHDESSSYTQPPPAYTEDHNGPQSPLLGPPRSENDNLPDDFRFGGKVSEGTIDIRMQFIRKVYAILTVQLLATTALCSVSFFSTGYRDWIQSHNWLGLVSLLTAMVFMGLTFWKRKSYPTNLLFLGGFTAFEAFAISIIVSFYETRIVLQALILTLGLFIGLTLFACQTKYDFTDWMPYLFGGLWALILFGFVAAFFPRTSTSELIFGAAGALIFSGYVLVDTQLILRKYHIEEEIAASISLYLDLINLFLSILRILNSRE